MNDLLAYLRAFPRQRIITVGDMMLDKYVWGQATRISQEAPVPVVQVSRQNAVPGGAANVVRNILSLGGQVLAAGVIGKDADGRQLCSLLEKAGADTSAILSLPGVETTVKTRVIAGAQQVVRVDYEKTGPLSRKAEGMLLERVQQALETGEYGALIFEDYAKGLFSYNFMEALRQAAERHGVFATLDPHPEHPFQVKGLRLITPNRMEAFRLAGRTFVPPSTANPLEDEALLQVGFDLMRAWCPELLLITLGPDGMILFQRGHKKQIHIPTRACKVFDVSGAGDTVMATMTAALLAGASPVNAARIANYAAGIVVGYVGTTPIAAEELAAKLTERS